MGALSYTFLSPGCTQHSAQPLIGHDMEASSVYGRGDNMEVSRVSGRGREPASAEREWEGSRFATKMSVYRKGGGWGLDIRSNYKEPQGGEGA